MLETVKYLLGSAGPSGFGSKSTAEIVTEQSPDLRSITAIITGKILISTIRNLIISYEKNDYIIM